MQRKAEGKQGSKQTVASGAQGLKMTEEARSMLSGDAVVKPQAAFQDWDEEKSAAAAQAKDDMVVSKALSTHHFA